MILYHIPCVFANPGHRRPKPPPALQPYPAAELRFTRAAVFLPGRHARIYHLRQNDKSGCSRQIKVVFKRRAQKTRSELLKPGAANHTEQPDLMLSQLYIFTFIYFL